MEMGRIHTKLKEVHNNVDGEGKMSGKLKLPFLFSFFYEWKNYLYGPHNNISN
jgi:hypothetical protein